MSDPVEHPKHYNEHPIEAWDILDMYFPKDPLLWNAGKYLLRAGNKGSLETDLKKAIQYLNRRLETESKKDKEQLWGRHN